MKDIDDQDGAAHQDRGQLDVDHDHHGRGVGRPASYKDDIETSPHLKLCGKAADEQEARAQELDLLGRWERARWIRDCGSPDRPYAPHPCNQRGWCPRCSKRIALENAGRAASGMRRMTNRLVGLFTVPVRWDAQARSKALQVEAFNRNIRMFRAALTEIRRRTCFRPVVGGVEVFEFELSKHGRSWNLQRHVVLDVATLDRVAVETALYLGQSDPRAGGTTVWRGHNTSPT